MPSFQNDIIVLNGDLSKCSKRGAFLDRSGRHCGLLRNPSAAEKEQYSLVVTVAGRDNERAQLYPNSDANRSAGSGQGAAKG